MYSCRNLVVGKDGSLSCRTTHVCFKPCCHDSGLFGKVVCLNGRLIWK